MDKKPAVYILASERNGTLYIGVTSDLIKRVWEHREWVVDGFTKKYSVHKLVYFEQYDDMENAIIREKRLKKWRRAWKRNRIEQGNPHWNDLWQQIVDEGYPRLDARLRGHDVHENSSSESDPGLSYPDHYIPHISSFQKSRTQLCFSSILLVVDLGRLYL